MMVLLQADSSLLGEGLIMQQTHHRPVMEAPSSKRLKLAESKTDTATDSSKLNSTDFGLAASAVWQGSPEHPGGAGVDTEKGAHQQGSPKRVGMPEQPVATSLD